MVPADHTPVRSGLALDGMPVIDVKPVLDKSAER